MLPFSWWLEAIDAAGITTWLGGLLIRFAGTSRVRLVLLMMGITALLTAFISVNGAVAALLPMVVVLAVRLGRQPAQLLMPMAFAAHAGSLLVLTGSPVNILILNAALASTGRGIGFFSSAWWAFPCLLARMGLAVWLGPKLLPDRTHHALPKDLSSHGETLMHHYLGGDQLTRLRIPAASALIGLPSVEPLGEHPAGLHLISVQRPDGRPVTAAKLSAGDQIIVRGDQRLSTASPRNTGSNGRRCHLRTDQQLLRRRGSRRRAPVKPRRHGGVPGNGHGQRRSGGAGS